MDKITKVSAPNERKHSLNLICSWSVYNHNFDFFTSLPSEITSCKLQYQDIQPMLSENHKHIPCIHLPHNQVHSTATDNATQLCKKPLLWMYLVLFYLMVLPNARIRWHQSMWQQPLARLIFKPETLCTVQFVLWRKTNVQYGNSDSINLIISQNNIFSNFTSYIFKNHFINFVVTISW